MVEGLHLDPFASGPSSGVGAGSNWSQNYSSEAVYVYEPGDTGVISPMDIAQGQIGDCFFLASLGEIIGKDPDFLYGAISGDPNGGEDVRLYDAASGGAVQLSTMHFVPVSVAVDNNFSPDAVNNYNTNDIVNGVKEIWPQIMEEAYAADNGGYGQITNGGYDSDAMESLTGQKAFYQDMSKVTGKELNALANSPNSIVTFDTPDSDGLPANLIGNHAYMFEGLVHQGGQTLVSLLNPWGSQEPDLIPLSQIKHDFVGITHGSI